ncbi:MAG: prepilin-type N-terminal cleavage/methylation domain-containing protein [Rhodobiaceae bacterium]|jgi:prepilin-type N-terminal cleavage/methylation domain-containing protein|nr:prepilin-type N-terminal cleavage/methylation domain-containing protein [Rhodobiaceae bacterium]MBT5517506.1 prepilin-type N-terminal cleavage/methylation domain-containing protein [Rhodobiaceae bacterium]MBT7279351.1 prepilin-type N-terminal cleavage/methylation domain-containing protein [Rhodobiaceae bacterium]
MRQGFSLIELLTVVAIIGILAAVGAVGYQGYIDAVKKDTTETNGRQIARAIEQDFLSLANGLKGTTELGTQVTIAGVKITSQVKADSSCYK